MCALVDQSLKPTGWCAFQALVGKGAHIGVTVLQYSIEVGASKSFDYLAGTGAININETNDEGDTAVTFTIFYREALLYAAYPGTMSKLGLEEGECTGWFKGLTEHYDSHEPARPPRGAGGGGG